MLLVGNRPFFKGAGPDGWIICGDPVSQQPALVAIPYPIRTNFWLSCDPNGTLTSVPAVGPQELFQISGNFVECERAGSLVLPCVPNLI